MADSASNLTPRETELAALQAKADEQNKARTGKGLRIRVGQTRGKNPKVIQWEAFDVDQPATLPESIPEFMTLTGTPETQQGQQLLVSYLVDGFNSSQYSSASDVLSEYVEPNWPPELVKSFKQAINGFVSSAGVSVEDAVSLMKPKIQAAFEAKMAAAKG